MRLFIALPIPDHARRHLREAVQHFRDSLAREPAEDRWHLTLLFLGEVDDAVDWPRHLPELAAKLPKLFIPTVTLTHAGRGRASGQLWAYAQAAGPLMDVQLTLQRETANVVQQRAERRAFVPHVRLAALKPEAKNTALADVPLSVSFAAREAELWRSDLKQSPPVYEKLGVMSLTP
jgi:2'-5' RNA ligase